MNLLSEYKKIAKHCFKNFKVSDDPKRKEDMKIRGYDLETLRKEKGRRLVSCKPLRNI